MLAQAIPIDLAIVVIDVALIPDADRLHGKIPLPRASLGRRSV
jgi:hypothetical protein